MAKSQNLIPWNSYSMGFIISAFIILAALGVYFAQQILESENRETQIIFFNVGQGDSILIRTEQGHDILIDGGPNNTVLKRLQDELGFFDRTLDLVIATHPDLDHIGGLSHVLNRYTVKTLMVSGHGATTTPARIFTAAIEKALQHGRLGTTTIAHRGDTIMSGSVRIEVLFPDRPVNNDWDTNTASIIVKVQEGDKDVLLTGDAPKMIERFLVEQGDVHDIEILKLGHHGSKTSTDPKFLDAAQPKVVIVSAAKPSRYGHPHPTVMKLVQERNIPSFETGDGNVVCSLKTVQCTHTRGIK